MRTASGFVIGLLLRACAVAAWAQESPSAPQGDAPRATPTPAPVATVAETMVVTASRAAEPVASAPVSMSVVTGTEIGSAGESGYAGLLRGLPGMNAIEVTTRQQELTTRAPVKTGANSQLVLLNGRSVYVDFLGFVLWDSMPVALDEVAAIEVLNGPGSAVWGANSLAGVINVLTKPPRSLAGGLVTVGLGERGTRIAGLHWADASKNWAWKASASYFEQDPWERESYTANGQPLPTYENEGTKQPKLDLRLDRDGDPEQRWSFRAGVGGMNGVSLNAAGPWLVKEGSRFYYGEARFARGTLDASLFVNRVEMEAPNGFSNLVNVLESTSFVLEATDRHALGNRQLLTYGASARESTCDLAVAPEADDRLEGGAFLQDDAELARWASLTVGARADWASPIGWVVSPRTAVILKVGGSNVLRMSFGRGYRTPSAVEFSSDIEQVTVLPLPTGPFAITTHLTGNEDLHEERNDSLELAWLARPTTRSSFTIAGYRTTTEGLVQVYPTSFWGPDNVPPGWPLPPQYVPAIPATLTHHNNGTMVNRGVELSGSFHLGAGTDLTAGYTWQGSPDVSGADPGAAVWAVRPPRNQAALRIHTTQGRAFGSIGLAYVDSAYWSDVLDSRFWGPTDAYTLLDAAAGWRIGARSTVVVRGTNLADGKVRQHYYGDIIRRKVTAELQVAF